MNTELVRFPAIKLPRELLEAVGAIAKEEEITFSEATRRALVMYAEQNGRKVDMPTLTWGGKRKRKMAESKE